ncbi:DNA starvation/stationary phase protection protein [Ornithinimicrobium ciconiae]|uniref:DNA starvation/stationary phase protection protein n=1 Tax=Ornithinimicrobium ciconiae TaxID=2594265 RepID=A0A516GEL3_9MICO|nr:DNA starvation/stationary phase protection protein [Ornithinimicrobium ciconiae]QDO89951.1 DNA starvation/stationary phase protection protein [Ornithinimicrobium ciconiae]
MTTTHTADALATSSEVAAGAAQLLSPVVIDLEALVVDGKQAHWHVRGPNFVGVHELLDQVVAHAQDFADTAAERIVAMGLPLDARIETVAAKNTLPTLTEGFISSDELIPQVIAQLDAVIATTREAIKGLDEVDLSSQDVAIAIEQGLVKDRWFLQAHLAN